MTDHYIYDLPPLGALTDDDLFYVVNEPAGAATSMKITALAMQSYLGAAGGCVTHTCGATGWRASGGTAPREIVHETAFQLEVDGNARGTYAVDLQQLRFAATDVAAGDYSAIYTNEENRIHPDSSYMVIVGTYNRTILAGSWEPNYNTIIGWSNYLYGDTYVSTFLGGAHTPTHAAFSQFMGYNNDTGGSSGVCFGVIMMGEANDMWDNAVDYPTYTLTGGVLNRTEGDVWLYFQWGEGNYILGDEPTVGGLAWVGFQFGYANHIENVEHNYQIGDRCWSQIPSGSMSDYYDLRFTFGSGANDYPPIVNPGGYNQNSWFTRSDRITTWAVAWTSSFEFPIVIDSIWYFLAYITGTEQDCANSFAWKIEGVVENDGGTTTILTSTVTNIYRDVATKEWQVIADNVNDRLVFQFRDTAGPDTDDCNIQMALYTVEVGYNS
jgi:hypothetical protein